MNNLPTNLRYLRKQRGLKQDGMLDPLGFSRSTWSNYENGYTDPSVGNLIKISRFFGISLDELILHDLNAGQPATNRPAKKTTQPVLYSTNDEVSVVAEEDFQYVLQEIKKLRQDVNLIKDSTQKK